MNSHCWGSFGKLDFCNLLHMAVPWIHVIWFQGCTYCWERSWTSVKGMWLEDRLLILKNCIFQFKNIITVWQHFAKEDVYAYSARQLLLCYWGGGLRTSVSDMWLEGRRLFFKFGSFNLKIFIQSDNSWHLAEDFWVHASSAKQLLLCYWGGGLWTSVSDMWFEGRRLLFKNWILQFNDIPADWQLLTFGIGFLSTCLLSQATTFVLFRRWALSISQWHVTWSSWQRIFIFILVAGWPPYILLF